MIPVEADPSVWVAIIGFIGIVFSAVYANKSAKRKAQQEADEAFSDRSNDFTGSLADHIKDQDVRIDRILARVEFLESRVDRLTMQKLHAKRFITRLEFQIIDLDQVPIERPAEIKDLFIDDD